MNKYICLCGMTFKNKTQGEKHILGAKLSDDGLGFPSHQIFKQHWHASLLECFLGADIIYYLAFVSGVIINGLLVSHSSLTDGERIVEAVCMGIVLTRIFKNERR